MCQTNIYIPIRGINRLFKRKKKNVNEHKKTTLEQLVAPLLTRMEIFAPELQQAE